MSLPESFARALWIRKTVGMAGFTCLVYDYFLTLEDEVTYIWMTPWTKTKVAFLINRYVNLFGQIFIRIEESGLVAHSSKFCRTFGIVVTILFVFCQESIHILVLLRAWAIWGCEQRVAAMLISIYTVYLFALLAISGLGAWGSLQQFLYLDLTGVCVSVIPASNCWFLAASFFLDTLSFVIAVRSLRRYSRDSQCLYPTPLVHELFRDVIAFYVASVLFNGFFLGVTLLYPDDPKFFLAIDFALPLLCISGQHLVLNLRGLTVQSYSPHTLSAEVDRQLAMLDDATPEGFQNRDGNREALAADDSGNELQDAIMVIGRSDADTEAGFAAKDELTVDPNSIELGEVSGARRRLAGSRSPSVMEVPRLPGE